jgi:hypothetical protein
MFILLKKDERGMENELRPEYDLQSLRVRKLGYERKHCINKIGETK